MKHAKGIALVTSIWLVLLVAIFGFALLTLSSVANVYANRQSWEITAFEAAQAGIADAMYNLADNAGWNSGFANKTLPNGKASYSLTFNTAAPFYSVNNLTGSSAANGYFGTATVPAGTAQIISTGTAYIAFGIPVTRKVFASVKVHTPSMFALFAAFGFESVNVGVPNCSIDGWSSENGTYNPPDPPGHFPNGGDIGTNSWVWNSTLGRYEVNTATVTANAAQASIYGDIYTGPGTTQAVSVGGIEGSNYGTWHALPEEIPMTPVVIPTASPGVQSGNTLFPGTYTTLPSNDFTLVSGTYVITGDVRLTGNVVINMNIVGNQPVKIYFNGSTWDTRGCSFQNSTELAKNLQIYGGDNCTVMDVRGSSGGYYVVYAPKAAITLHSSATSEIYGSIVGKTVAASSGQAYLHHDNNLDDVGPTSGLGQALLLGWQEL